MTNANETASKRFIKSVLRTSSFFEQTLSEFYSPSFGDDVELKPGILLLNFHFTPSHKAKIAQCFVLQDGTIENLSEPHMRMGLMDEDAPRLTTGLGDKTRMLGMEENFGLWGQPLDQPIQTHHYMIEKAASGESHSDNDPSEDDEELVAQLAYRTAELSSYMKRRLTPVGKHIENIKSLLEVSD